MTLPSSLPTRNKRKLHPCASGPLEPRRCWTSLDSIAASRQAPPPCPPPPSSPLSLSIGRTLQVTGLTVWQVCGFVYVPSVRMYSYLLSCVAKWITTNLFQTEVQLPEVEEVSLVQKTTRRVTKYCRTSHSKEDPSANVQDANIRDFCSMKLKT